MILTVEVDGVIEIIISKEILISEVMLTEKNGMESFVFPGIGIYFDKKGLRKLKVNNPKNFLYEMRNRLSEDNKGKVDVLIVKGEHKIT